MTVAIVTGGSRGLGRAVVKGLLEEGWAVVTDARTPSELAATAAVLDPGDGRLSLVMGKAFAPNVPLWGKLIDLRRGSSHLFLRYSFPWPSAVGGCARSGARGRSASRQGLPGSA